MQLFLLIGGKGYCLTDAEQKQRGSDLVESLFKFREEIQTDFRPSPSQPRLENTGGSPKRSPEPQEAAPPAPGKVLPHTF